MDKKDEEVKQEVKVQPTEQKVTTQSVYVEEPSKVKAIDRLKGVFTIRPVKTTWLKSIDPKHDGAVVLSKANHWLSPERDNRPPGLIKTGLTDQMARELEVEMGLKPMELSPYSKWWDINFKIYPRIPKEGLELNLDANATNKLIYCYAKVMSKVALSESDAAENPLVDYVLTSKEVEADYSNKKAEIKTKAVQRYAEMSLNEQMDFLKVFDEGRSRVTKSASPNFITSTIFKIVDERPEDFIELVENPDFKTMVFIQDCVAIGALKKEGPKYRINGGDIIGNSLLDTINNLQKPEYNEAKLSLKTKLDLTKK
jgi:hypothetical protein